MIPEHLGFYIHLNSILLLTFCSLKYLLECQSSFCRCLLFIPQGEDTGKFYTTKITKVNSGVRPIPNFSKYNFQSLSQKFQEKQTHHDTLVELYLGVFVEGFRVNDSVQVALLSLFSIESVFIHSHVIC